MRGRERGVSLADRRAPTASRTLSSAQDVARRSAERPRARAVQLDVASPELGAVIAAHDLVVSLVPYVHHAKIIRLAVQGGTHVVTTSYISAAIGALHDAAAEAGITVLNEVGVDPGVDHLYAVKAIHEIHEKGGKVNLDFFCPASTLPLYWKYV